MRTICPRVFVPIAASVAFALAAFSFCQGAKAAEPAEVIAAFNEAAMKVEGYNSQFRCVTRDILDEARKFAIETISWVDSVVDSYAGFRGLIFFTSWEIETIKTEAALAKSRMRKALERTYAKPPCPPPQTKATTPPSQPLPPPPQSIPNAPRTSTPPCRSADNAAEIDAKIAKLETEVASLTNRLRTADSAAATDEKNYRAFLGAFGPGDPRTKAASDAVAQDDKTGELIRDALSIAETSLSALKALPPCLEEHKTAPQPPPRPIPPPQPIPSPQPRLPAPGPGVTPQPPPVTPPAIPPEVAPQHSMAPGLPGTGFYVGFNAGGASGSSRWLEPAPAASTNTFGVSGGLAGGTFGYQAWNGLVMFGLEADIAGGGISGSTSVGCVTPCRTSNSWLATVRGRAGYDLGPVTPFVTGGLAVGDVNAHVAAFPGAGRAQAGWAAGAGLQVPLRDLAELIPAIPLYDRSPYTMTTSPSLGKRFTSETTGMYWTPAAWTLKAEWLHVDLGSPHVCAPATCGGTANITSHAEVFRIGIDIPLSAPTPR